MSAEFLAAAMETARRAVREAGRIQKEGLGFDRRIEHKGLFNLVTDVDRRCEEAVLEILARDFPDIPVLAEESSPELRASGRCWVLDPLDGTTNYARGYPLFCCSLALLEDDRPVLGAVYEPLRDELFWASAGGGAFLNDRPIRVTDTAELSQALLATGFPYQRAEQPETNLDRFCVLTLRCRGVRRGGSAALDLCYTACGRLDGFWEIGLQIWDVSAGTLIVEQAGGTVTDFQGRPSHTSGREIVASNGRLQDKLLEALRLPAPHGRCFG